MVPYQVFCCAGCDGVVVVVVGVGAGAGAVEYILGSVRLLRELTLHST
jgi:hypothetical protein